MKCPTCHQSANVGPLDSGGWRCHSCDADFSALQVAKANSIRVDATNWKAAGPLGDLAKQQGIELPQGDFFGPVLWPAPPAVEADAPITVEAR